MNRYINCIAHNSSDGNLIIGDTHAAFIDCGMAFCAGVTIQKAKEALGGRPLDYMLMSHTHYDHIGALPFFRKEWPMLKTITTEIGAGILLKDTPRRVIRELSSVAAEKYGVTINTYSDDDFRGDIIVKDGDRISLGGLTVEVIETPGHTRDSISFYIPELELLILNETLGVMISRDIICTSYLTSYNDTIASIEKCKKIPFKFLSLPHLGIVPDNTAFAFLDKSLAETNACRDFILRMKEEGLNEEQMQEAFYEQYYNEILAAYQPKEAFMANAKATIACTLKEAVNI